MINAQMRWLELLSTVRIGSKSRALNWHVARSTKIMTVLFFRASGGSNRKTQVHPLTQHDGIHTRLTHSLEVSCIGRSLGMLAAEKISFPLGVTRADEGHHSGSMSGA